MKSLKIIFYFILSFIVFFIFGFYIYYRYKYFGYSQDFDRAYKFYKEIYPEDIILKTGARLVAPEERFQHFLNFSPKKKKGVIRIGAFGDSYTFGTEIKKTASYPYYLQQFFNENFPKRSIEVLNFGVGGSGVTEQFFLWEKYAEIYHLDYILIGPASFYSERVTGFTLPGPYIQNPKNRFILTENHQIKEVHIKGKTLKERFKNYYKLIPSWT
ncbi:MAG: hypothetical protein OXN83_02700, partial [Oligoflexia bacterium]|nr:hypothetical protein [Oligoflexia bacterium]